MKRILAIILCLAIIALAPACKPDNIQPPAEIIKPDEQEQNEALGLGTEKEEEPEQKEEEKEEETEAENPAETPSEEKNPEEQADAPKEEQQEEEALPDNKNPLAAEDFLPSKTAASALAESGLVKKPELDSVLKNRTITFYTADDNPAFTYTDEEGQLISELDWIKAFAKEQGFMVQYSIKPAALSVKAQRAALFAGKKLSLIQLDASDLAVGLTLCASAKEYLDLENQSFGISKAVLTQSDYKLFAPVGMVDSLWYNTALVGESDPASLEKRGEWTVESFKTLCKTNAEKQILPLLMESALPWATLSGKAPITLKEGKLDTNINSIGSKEVWSALQTMNKEIPSFIKDEDLSYTLASGTALMEYTTTPATAETITLSYAPLPKLTAEGNSTVTFSGTFFALPKYGYGEKEESSALAALLFAEHWCNRFSEARAETLQALGIKGSAYQAYADLAEEKGMLLLYNSRIEEMVGPYLKGLTDESVNMQQEYSKVITKLYAYVKTQNVYYS